VPVIELRLPIDAMGERLVGRDAGLFKQEKGCLQSERKRETYATVFRNVRRRLERESFGEWRGG